MCGVGGYFLPDGRMSVERGRRVLSAMSDALAPRGPDASGQFVKDNLGLVHRRLAIIDLSPGGEQPMFYADSRFAITFNGEIYNYVALREELRALGASFQTQSDTEVILAGYAYWGPAVLDRLRGMYAGAIYDRDNETLFLFRDIFGEKPLYYTSIGEGVAFASEIKALLLIEEVSRDLHPPSINRYLGFQYVPGPETIFEKIQGLPPATCMTVYKDGRRETRRYWTVPQAQSHHRQPLRDLLEETRGRVTQAIRRQTVADVPLGIMLSGGIDSGTITSVLSHSDGEMPKTFTVGFQKRDIDERSDARATAELFGTDHAELNVANNIPDLVERIFARFDQPLSDPAAIPVYALSEMMSKKVKVALSGDGGDEILLGYSRYLGVKAAAMARLAPMGFRRPLSALAKRLPFERSPIRLMRYMQRLLTEIGKSEADRYADWICVFSDETRRDILADTWQDTHRLSVGEEIAASLKGPDTAVGRAATFDINQYLPYDLLMKTDMMSMSHGLEVRCPFLDRDLVEFCAALPVGARLPMLQSKWLLRAAFDQALPDDILALPKRGLSVPLAEWLSGPLKEMVHETLMRSRLAERGILDQTRLEGMVQQFYGGDVSLRYRLWCLLSLEMWLRHWVDRPSHTF